MMGAASRQIKLTSAERKVMRALACCTTSLRALAVRSISAQHPVTAYSYDSCSRQNGSNGCARSSANARSCRSRDHVIGGAVKGDLGEAQQQVRVTIDSLVSERESDDRDSDDCVCVER